MSVAKKKTTKCAVKNVKKDIERLNKINKSISEASHELLALYPAKKYLESKLDEAGVDNDPGIDVPLHARGGRWKWNFESENMSSELAIMWILAGLCILFALFAMHGDQQALNAGLIH